MLSLVKVMRGRSWVTGIESPLKWVGSRYRRGAKTWGYSLVGTRLCYR